MVLQNTSSFKYRNADFVTGMTAESVRLSAKFTAGQAAVLPFAWNYYHDTNYMLSSADMLASLQNPLLAGGDGVILWGDPTTAQDASMAAYLNSTLGPLALQTVQASCVCAAKQCSAHGACTSTGCKCLPGYAGPSCAET